MRLKYIGTDRHDQFCDKKTYLDTYIRIYFLFSGPSFRFVSFCLFISFSDLRSERVREIDSNFFLFFFLPTLHALPLETSFFLFFNPPPNFTTT